MNIEPLSQTDLSDVEPMGFDEATPLWFYILKEAELMAEGRMLGPVGGRIVAEVFIGLLQGDRGFYLQQNPTWTPTLGQDFSMADLPEVRGRCLERARAVDFALPGRDERSIPSRREGETIRFRAVSFLVKGHPSRPRRRPTGSVVNPREGLCGSGRPGGNAPCLS